MIRLTNIVILQDTRERTPWNLLRFNGVETSSIRWQVNLQKCALNVGDYSLLDAPSIAIERKSLQDIVSTLANIDNRRRFTQECLKRSVDREINLTVIIEGLISDILAGHYHGNMHPHSILMTCHLWTQRYGIPFIWCQNRHWAEEYAFMLLRIYQQKWNERKLGSVTKANLNKIMKGKPCK